MLYLIEITLISGFACYLAGFILRKFVSRYQDFQYRFSLPIIAYCIGSIAALILMTQAMSWFLVDALYQIPLVRQYPGFIIGTLDFAAYALGGYYSTKYVVRLAHKLDLRRNAERDRRTSQETIGKSLTKVGKDLFRTESNNEIHTKEELINGT
jgi:hypothetical protein